MLYLGGGYPGQYFPINVRILPAWAALPTINVEMPMVIVTGGVTRPVLVPTSADQSMWMRRATTLAVTRGMSTRVTVPLRLTPDVTLEH